MPSIPIPSSSSSSSPTTSDVLILGASHAGLSAAQTLYRHGHTCTILDASTDTDTHNPHLKDPSSPSRHYIPPFRLVPGHEGGSAADFIAATKSELKHFAGDLVEFVHGAEIISVRRLNSENRAKKVSVNGTASTEPEVGGEQEIFEAEDARGKTWLGRTLLLATGAQDERPDVEGYVECWLRRIFHCLFTFGSELRGTADTAALWARDAMADPFHVAMLAGDALKIARRVCVLLDGKPEKEEAVREKISGILGGEMIPLVSFEERQVVGLRLVEREGESERIKVAFAKDSSSGGRQSETTFAFLVHQPLKRQARSMSPILESLGVALDPRGDIQLVSPFGSTTAPGVFAAGDCASLFKIVPAALFSGAAAGAGIARAVGAGIVRRRFGIGNGLGKGVEDGVGAGVEEARREERDGESDGIEIADGKINGAVLGVGEEVRTEVALSA